MKPTQPDGGGHSTPLSGASTLVLTVLGNDRPGLVRSLARIVAEGGGNWERAQLVHLAGQFAGLVEVSVAAEREQDLVGSLQAVEGLELVVRSGTPAREPEGGTDAARQSAVVLELVGNDRPGIVAEITRVLDSLGVNIERLETSTDQAAMAGGALFRARAVLTLPGSAETDEVRDALQALAGELMVDLVVDPDQG